MTGRPSRDRGALFEARVARAAARGERTLAGLAQQDDVHPDQITTWRALLLEGASEVFEKGAEKALAPAVDAKALHAEIGEPRLADDFARRAREGRSVAGREAMTDRGHGLSSARRARALGIGRGSVHAGRDLRPGPISR